MQIQNRFFTGPLLQGYNVEDVCSAHPAASTIPLCMDGARPLTLFIIAPLDDKRDVSEAVFDAYLQDKTKRLIIWSYGTRNKRGKEEFNSQIGDTMFSAWLHSLLFKIESPKSGKRAKA